MADRDFAQLQATVKPAGSASVMSGLKVVLLVVGIFSVVIMGFVGGYWLGSHQGRESAVVAAKARLQAQLDAQKKELDALRQQAQKNAAKTPGNTPPTMEVGDLTFYTDLPKQSVNPQPLSQPVTPTDTAPPAAQPQPAPSSQPAVSPSSSPATNGSDKMVASIIQRELDRKPLATNPGGAASFYVQVASFRDTNESATTRQKLQAAGFASRIQKADVPGRGTWYRLQVGPYASRDAASAAQTDLAKRLHMQGIVVRGGN